MKWKERKQRHNDVHHPMQGKGKRATRPKSRLPAPASWHRQCSFCPAQVLLGNDHWCDVRDERRGSNWRQSTMENTTKIEDGGSNAK